LQTETTQQAPPAEPESKADSDAKQEAPEGAARANAPAAKGDVLNRVIPDVPEGASRTIRGTVAVAVRVTVDATGAVTGADFESHGPSAYFARMAMDAAHGWKFKAPQQDGRAVASTWVLRYEFRRNGTDAKADQMNP
jgi:TonB family protein